MTGKAAAVQGGLASLGLLVALGTWQREPERAPGEIAVIDAGKGDLGDVHYEDETNAVDIRRGDGGSVWLRVAEKPPAPPADKDGDKKDGDKDGKKAAEPAAAKKPPPPPAKPVRPPRDLRGDTTAEKLFEQLATLKSPRAFGVLDDKKLKELGLDAPKKKLTLTVRGQPRAFAIGQPSPGGAESYLRDLADGRTYLMPRALLSDLQGASHRLIDRRVHTFKIAEVDRVVLAIGGQTRELAILNRESQTGYKLASPKTPDKPDEMARNWHDKVWRIYAMDVLGKGEKPALGEPKVALRIDYFDGKKNAGWIEIGKVDPPPSPPVLELPVSGAPAEGPKAEYYARSEHTAGWIKIQSDAGYVADAEKVLSGS